MTAGSGPDMALGHTSPPVFELRNISKRFGGEQALISVDLEVRGGEVHGLLGPNGSGKSTLIKILSGYHAAEPGAELLIHGRPQQLPLTATAFRRLGFSFVHQDLGLIPSLSVLENLCLDEIVSAGWRIKWRSLARQARTLLAEFGLDVDPRATISELPPWHRPLIAVVRAIGVMRAAMADAPDRRGALILDEPSARMSEETVSYLLEVIRSVASLGHGVLLVSHNLDEIHSVTNRVTVLRDGRVVGALVTAETSRARLVDLIVGEPRGGLPARIGPAPGPSAAATATAGLGASAEIQISGLRGAAVREFSFRLRPGEIVGVTGLVGSGFDDVGALLFGDRRAAAGILRVGARQQPLSRMTPDRAVGAGIALVPPDRLSQGCIPELTVAENIAMPALDSFTAGGAIRRREMDRQVAAWTGQLGVTPANPELTLSSLSGGNQQKVLLAKWLQLHPRLLIAIEPTQGVDVGARAEIFSLLKDYATHGCAILCCSTDTDQLAELCDAVCVMHAGRLGQVLRGADITRERITAAVLDPSLPGSAEPP
jgi:ribose transport system ATP-binding protein